MFKVILGVLFFTIFTLVVFLNLDPKLATSTTQQITSVSVDYLTASLSGEVQKPGTYIVEKNATLQTIISLAGGTTNNADDAAFNLTLPLLGGQSYYIAPLYDPTDVCGTNVLVKVGINSASKENLMTLSNIGASLAEAIITYRQQHGSFTHLEAIMQVSGIGQSTFTRIKNYITLT
jgi:competence protein ComEA